MYDDELYTVRARVYATDEDGNDYLLHRPGDRITAEEAGNLPELDELGEEAREAKLDGLNLKELKKVAAAEGIAAGADADSTLDCIAAILAVRAARQGYAKLGELNLVALKAIATDQGIDHAGANTRAEYIAVIEGRPRSGRRQTKKG